MMTPASSTDSATVLRRDIDKLKTDLRQVGGDLSSVTQNAVEAARAGAAVVKEQLGDHLQQVAEKGKESVQAVRTQVAGHPLASVAAAFAVGALLGFSLSRRG